MSSRKVRLVGSHEVKIMLGNVSRQRTYQITNHPDFPKPAAVLTQGNVWFAEDIEAWIAEHPRPTSRVD